MTRRMNWRYPQPAFPEITGGPGALDHLEGWLDEHGVGPVLVVTSPSLLAEGELLQRVCDRLGNRLTAVFGEVQQHSPIEQVRAALAALEASRAQALLSLGGGSSIDTAKGVLWYRDPAFERPPIVHIAVPSTFSGAEFTTDAGITIGTGKQVHSDRRLIPRLVVLDPSVPATAPTSLLRASLVNALAHCLEGCVSVGGSPMSDAFFLRAIRLIDQAASELTTGSGLQDGQAAAALAALHQVPMGVAHALVHVLGGRYRIPHAATHGVMAAPVMRLNLPAVADRQAGIAEALHVDHLTAPAWQRAWKGIDAVQTLIGSLGLPSSLSELGVPRGELAQSAEEASRDSSYHHNPVPLDPAAVRTCLEWAWTGEVPPP